MPLGCVLLHRAHVGTCFINTCPLPLVTPTGRGLLDLACGAPVGIVLWSPGYLRLAGQFSPAELRLLDAGRRHGLLLPVRCAGLEPGLVAAAMDRIPNLQLLDCNAASRQQWLRWVCVDALPLPASAAAAAPASTAAAAPTAAADEHADSAAATQLVALTAAAMLARACAFLPPGRAPATFVQQVLAAVRRAQQQLLACEPAAGGASASGSSDDTDGDPLEAQLRAAEAALHAQLTLRAAVRRSICTCWLSSRSPTPS